MGNRYWMFKNSQCLAGYRKWGSLERWESRVSLDTPLSYFCQFSLSLFCRVLRMSGHRLPPPMECILTHPLLSAAKDLSCPCSHLCSQKDGCFSHKCISSISLLTFSFHRRHVTCKQLCFSDLKCRTSLATLGRRKGEDTRKKLQAIS